MARSGDQSVFPRWLLIALLVQLPLWPLGFHWANNSYSGWNEIARVYAAGQTPLTHSQGPRSVTVVAPNGRKWEFDSYRDGSSMARIPETEVGFDETGFWVRALGAGWFAGPATPVYIPWRDVKACDGLRVHMRHSDYALIIFDQSLLDACERNLAVRRGRFGFKREPSWVDETGARSRVGTPSNARADLAG